MNLLLRPSAGLSKFLSDWPSDLLGRDFFASDMLPTRLGVNVPSVNIKETSTDYVLEVAAPGLERKDFNIEVKNDTLTISGEKEEEKEEKEEKNGYSRKEYSFNSFSRSFSLPENADESAIKAKYENGILRISIAKTKEPAAQSPTKIQVS